MVFEGYLSCKPAAPPFVKSLLAPTITNSDMQRHIPTFYDGGLFIRATAIISRLQADQDTSKVEVP